MGLIIDTSLIVAAERGKFDLTALLASRSATGARLSAVTASELLVGVHCAGADRLAARTALAVNLPFREPLYRLGSAILPSDNPFPDHL